MFGVRDVRLARQRDDLDLANVEVTAADEDQLGPRSQARDPQRGSELAEIARRLFGERGDDITRKEPRTKRHASLDDAGDTHPVRREGVGVRRQLGAEEGPAR
jgi:hypothetical protein